MILTVALDRARRCRLKPRAAPPGSWHRARAAQDLYRLV